MNIPKDHQTVMPYLMIDDAGAYIEFIKSVFNAEVTRESMRDGVNWPLRSPHRSQHNYISQSRDQWKAAAANMFVYVDDADATYFKAIKSGATSQMEPADLDYGRSGGVTDPFGNVW